MALPKRVLASHSQATSPSERLKYFSMWGERFLGQNLHPNSLAFLNLPTKKQLQDEGREGDCWQIQQVNHDKIIRVKIWSTHPEKV